MPERQKSLRHQVVNKAENLKLFLRSGENMIKCLSNHCGVESRGEVPKVHSGMRMGWRAHIEAAVSHLTVFVISPECQG